MHDYMRAQDLFFQNLRDVEDVQRQEEHRIAGLRESTLGVLVGEGITMDDLRASYRRGMSGADFVVALFKRTRDSDIGKFLLGEVNRMPENEEQKSKSR